MRQKKVLAVASAGGHWKQLMRLYPAFADCNVVFVSTLQQVPPNNAPLYLVADANRKNLLPFFGQILKLIKVLFLERPDCIVTTGAAPGLITLFLGRLTGIPGAWIDSFANVEKLSLSGRIASRFARLHLTQWSHLAVDERPGYAGSVL